ncbi:Predicted secreted protein [Palleronia marisminoris]|uniref:Uncharacterized protein n=1 Tax=Palleronia marisminoris TaxID=315423 RepID=A0A1Y5T3Z8_9RHOB|nr:DUF1467 family protein [Palleronia marisminoris]SFH16145.1 Predicted secreted protein [Palleronia marisminoris]SLN55304.1 hypothetical protein PAM7066_02637 [Palleronia marisminoris]
MGPTAAIVLYAVVWFMVFFVILPIGLSTQGDEGEIVPGTHAGSPARFPLKRKVIQTTIWGTLIWAVIAAVIVSGKISVQDFDWFDRMSPRAGEAGDTGA